MRPDDVMQTLQRYMLVDGFDIVIDFDRSAGSRIVDARSGRSFLDMFTMFSSHPLGMNHPRLLEPEFVEKLGRTAVNKPSNSDIYTVEMAAFVDTFSRVAAPPWMKHLFLIAGGALAVENALKVAFDWKVRLNQARGLRGEVGSRIIHLEKCFHGRSGYTLSLTNTDPAKTMNFPKFDWPRVHSPAMVFPCEGENLAAVEKAERRSLDEVRAAVREHGDDIAALIIEPIQGEGGDNHFRGEFLAALRQLCTERDIFLIFDEVQTGLGMTGQWWAHQHFGVEPDVMAFGKKTQICGIAVGERVDEVPDNVFSVSSRINSTWGGNLVDMVRATRYIEIIQEENLLDNARERGAQALARLGDLAARHPAEVDNVRGRGLFIAFDLASPELRAVFLQECFGQGLLALGCGTRSVRMRPALNVSGAEMDEAVDIMERALPTALEKVSVASA